MVITRADRLNGQTRSYTACTVETARSQNGFVRWVERLQRHLGNGEAQNRWAGDEVLGCLVAALACQLEFACPNSPPAVAPSILHRHSQIRPIYSLIQSQICTSMLSSWATLAVYAVFGRALGPAATGTTPGRWPPRQSPLSPATRSSSNLQRAASKDTGTQQISSTLWVPAIKVIPPLLPFLLLCSMPAFECLLFYKRN
jgi:hypothetical protein